MHWDPIGSNNDIKQVKSKEWQSMLKNYTTIDSIHQLSGRIIPCWILNKLKDIHHMIWWWCKARILLLIFRKLQVSIGYISFARYIYLLDNTWLHINIMIYNEGSNSGFTKYIKKCWRGYNYFGRNICLHVACCMLHVVFY